MRVSMGVFFAAFHVLGNTTCCAAQFCDDVKGVLAVSAGISDLAGASKSAIAWDAKRNVSGLSPCEVQKLKKGDLIFTCNGAKSRSFDDAKRDYDKLQKDIELCLPVPSWNHMVTGNGQDFNMHAFTLARDGLSGNVSLFKNFDFDVQSAKTWDVWFPVLTIYQRHQ